MNQMLQTIMERRSTRKYNEKPVSEEQLSDIVEAGRFAPTGGNSQTVHFVVITNAEIRKELRGLVKDAFARMELQEGQYASIQNAIRLSKRGTYAFDYHAPILIVVANRKGYPNAMADSACALQNMMLEAESLGVGSCWINQLHWLDENPTIREFLKPLGISGEETICGALALGNYDEKQAVKPRTGMKADYIR
ncbi:MAG: nitroreductase family protein [Lachnospiraceae bacterium]|nr:nitroreductase family protein [Lachnospiraceae bacterium]MCD8250362.1 nitroreductase family protein [Lachnospiraceae bacterium]